jgi:hypothetical protein
MTSFGSEQLPPAGQAPDIDALLALLQQSAPQSSAMHPGPGWQKVSVDTAQFEALLGRQQQSQEPEALQQPYGREQPQRREGLPRTDSSSSVPYRYTEQPQKESGWGETTKITLSSNDVAQLAPTASREVAIPPAEPKPPSLSEELEDMLARNPPSEAQPQEQRSMTKREQTDAAIAARKGAVRRHIASFSTRQKIVAATGLVVLLGGAGNALRTSSSSPKDASASILKARASATASVVPGASKAAVAPVGSTSLEPSSAAAVAPALPKYKFTPINQDPAHPSATVAVTMETQTSWEVTEAGKTATVEGIYPAGARPDKTHNGTIQLYTFMTDPTAVWEDATQNVPGSKIIDVDPSKMVTNTGETQLMYGIIETDPTTVYNAVVAAIPEVAAEGGTQAQRQTALIADLLNDDHVHGKITSQNPDLTTHQEEDILYPQLDANTDVQQAERAYIKAKITAQAKAQGINSTIINFIDTTPYSITKAALAAKPPKKAGFVLHGDQTQITLTVTPGKS